MIMSRMPECPIQCTPLSKSTVDSFMPVSCTSHSIIMLLVTGIKLRDDLLVAPVSKITKRPFCFTKYPLGGIPKDIDVRPLSSRKRPIISNDITSSNASNKLIRSSRPSELVRLPVLTEWRWLVDLEVNAINTNSRFVAVESSKPVAPSNLHGGGEQ